MTSADVFSPNEKEAISLVGPGTPIEIISRLVELGAQARPGFTKAIPLNYMFFLW